MRTLDAALESELASQSPQYFLRAYLYVRTWGGSSYAYGTAIDISDELVSTTPLKIKLDREGYSVWTYSNCTVNMRNDRNNFKQGNTTGYFGTDKIIRGSKIKIEAGTILPDGSESLAAIYTGFVHSEPIYDPEQKTVSLILLGHLKAFEEANAETISTAYTDILLGSDSGTTFNTTTDKVGIISSVKKGATDGGAGAATELIAGTDYTTSGLDGIGPAATITLTAALTPGESLWATWLQWYENKSIEWVVAQLCTAAGITDTEISPVSFSSQVEYEYLRDTQAEWQAGTLVHTDATAFPGSVQLSQYQLISIADWLGSPPYMSTFEYSHGTAGHGSSSPSGSDATGWKRVATSNTAYGTWDFRIFSEVAALGSGVKFFFVDSSANVNLVTEGYACGLDHATGKIKLWRCDAGTFTELWASSGTTYYNTPGGAPNPLTSTKYYRVRIMRTSANVFYVAIYNNAGTLLEGGFGVAAATDATYTTTNYYTHFYFIKAGMPPSDYIGVLYIYYGTTEATGGGIYEQTGTWESPTIDGTAALSNWGLLTVSETIPAGTTVLIETREKATAGGTWSAYTPILISGQINATLRYLQIRWTATANTAQNLTPIIYSLSAKYYKDTVSIPLVKMTGLNCLEALEQLAQMCCYELGFNAQDVFIFRPRNSTLVSVAALDGKNIEKITTITDGTERVYNRVNAEYGVYRVIADPTSEGDTAPTSQDKYSVRELVISAGNFLAETAANLAKAIAPTVYAYTSTAKRRVILDAKFIMNLELGDRVTVNYPEGDIFTLWLWGDSDRAYGDTDIEYYSSASIPGAMTLAGVDMRVEGIEFDMENWRTRYDLVEVV